MTNLKGKTAVITGASSGIGRSVSGKLADLGVHVIAVARRADRLKELAKLHKNIEPLVADVTGDLGELKARFSKGGVDILINNAGLAMGREPIQSLDPKDWNTTIDTNIKALISVTQLLLPQMIEKKSGDIINVGSIAGFHAYPSGSVYNATKFAVRALTEAWSMDLLGKGIRVMGIHPGMVETEFSVVRYKGDEVKAKQIYEGMRPLTADDIADSIVWALSRPAHVNIQTLIIMPTDQASVGMVHRTEKKLVP